MKVAIVGSRNLTSIEIERYLVDDVEEIVSGGAVGVDACAAMYAKNKGLKLTEFLPQYERYGRAAPIVRNKKIVDYADKIIVFWNGSSRGTLSVIQYAKKTGKPLEVVICEPFMRVFGRED
ncbi:MAG: hypothetical protein E7639_05390 [Ruminococcaceae bacterium]|nr:hypothetical protein [Oscillospiraceae bacterium]